MTIDLSIARACLKFAAHAYNEAHINERTSSTQVVFGGLLSDPDAIIVSFRGSREPHDYLADTKFAFKARLPWPLISNARVHRGFVFGEQSVEDRIFTRIAGYKRVYFTGHSLGASETMICALRAKEHGFPVAGVHTFGCPRVGNGDWAELYNVNLHDLTIRWEAQADCIPWMPPLLCNYRHAGRAAYLKNDGRVIVEPNLIDHAPAFAETIGRSETSIINTIIRLFDPHKIANYEELFAKMKEEV